MDLCTPLIRPLAFGSMFNALYVIFSNALSAVITPVCHNTQLVAYMARIVAGSRYYLTVSISGIFRKFSNFIRL